MSSIDTFGIDLAELDDVVRDLERTESSLQRITSDLEQQMKALHDVWEGLAAQAHTEAHRQWTEGMATMRQAMIDLRTAARLAHGNYTAAAEANTTMWRDMQ